MKGFLIIFCILILLTGLSGQEPVIPADTIIESDGQLFMPGYPGTIEKSLQVDPQVVRLRPSQVSLLKRKLMACTELITRDSVFHELTGIKVLVRQEILRPEGNNDQLNCIPSSVEIDFFTTLAKDSLPYWESTPDARIIIYFNNPQKIVGNPVIQNIYIEPVQTDLWYPFIEYDRISVPNQVTAAKKNDLPWFEPVSREDFILTLITFFQVSIEKAEKKKGQTGNEVKVIPHEDAERQKFAAEIEKIRKYDPILADRLVKVYSSAEETGIPENTGQNTQSGVDNTIVLNTWREAVRKLRAEMNAMTPLELKSQAWWSDMEESNVSGLTPAAYSGSRPLVRLNKNLIDKTKSGSSIQVIITEWSMLPGTDFTDITGYNLTYDKISQIAKNLKLWQQIYDLIDP